MQEKWPLKIVCLMGAARQMDRRGFSLPGLLSSLLRQTRLSHGPPNQLKDKAQDTGIAPCPRTAQWPRCPRRTREQQCSRPTQKGPIPTRPLPKPRASQTTVRNEQKRKWQIFAKLYQNRLTPRCCNKGTSVWMLTWLRVNQLTSSLSFDGNYLQWMKKDEQLVCGKILLLLVPLLSPSVSSLSKASERGKQDLGRLQSTRDTLRGCGHLGIEATFRGNLSSCRPNLHVTPESPFPFRVWIAQGLPWNWLTVPRRNSPAPTEKRVSLLGRKLFCQNISWNVLPAHLDMSRVPLLTFHSDTEEAAFREHRLFPAKVVPGGKECVDTAIISVCKISHSYIFQSC